ncbi:LysE family translocator [Azospirillum picis]|uniref:Threonine/homoserine/homoserine lactone efflux protein n=1 Tax=Azospirillum picis TaxID=488438 RepID=A0ABU0MRE0_9PROT|nr:LysE family translocator [Azospirillum picis]MBP2302456.1 threonine/homoserine/homoserine lactone efflux protein [Azospirillum picis]MDQ0536035.1 threonine/homoserine/homoserine lactone efflux protein [Azospirillum picis]
MPTLYLSMAGFALAASISPGPVNMVALASGLAHGLRASLHHVAGATVGFTVLLVLAGLGLAELLRGWPAVEALTRWLGAAFLAWMAWRLWGGGGDVAADAVAPSPSFLQGAAMQWLNPKAWIAALAGVGAYAGDDPARLWSFAALYFVICYLSVGAWAYAGARMRHLLADRRRMRLFNRAMAAVLAASAVQVGLAG